MWLSEGSAEVICWRNNWCLIEKMGGSRRRVCVCMRLWVHAKVYNAWLCLLKKKSWSQLILQTLTCDPGFGCFQCLTSSELCVIPESSFPFGQLQEHSFRRAFSSSSLLLPRGSSFAVGQAVSPVLMSRVLPSTWSREQSSHHVAFRSVISHTELLPSL